MEEQSLYRAILSTPHDDAPRLIYADWLDENADGFSTLPARIERARAELIRIQCKIARAGPGGWGFAELPTDALALRQQRLLFQHGKRWRRDYPVTLSSAPYDRGFLRPMRAMRPQEFLEQSPSEDLPIRGPLPPLPVESQVRRYVPEKESTFLTCPLWDIHLFASEWNDDPLADHGQYGDLLAKIGQSPFLERVGRLKLSFFQTPVHDFLRTGNFTNVETLILNCVPFPDVLEAVTENESFRSLRYIDFGSDQEIWAGGYPRLFEYLPLYSDIRAANQRHVPYGEMRTVLRGIIRNTLSVPTSPSPSEPPPEPARLRRPLTLAAPSSSGSRFRPIIILFVLAAVARLLGAVSETLSHSASPSTLPNMNLRYDPEKHKIAPRGEQK